MTLLFAALLLGLIPAIIGRRKNHSFAGWWFVGSALFVIALPAVLLVKRRPTRTTKGFEVFGNLVLAALLIVSGAITLGPQDAQQIIAAAQESFSSTDTSAQASTEPNNSAATSVPPDPVSNPSMVIPDDEKSFIEVVERRASAYEDAGNDMLKGAQRVGRKTDLCLLLKSTAVKNWIGTVTTLSSNSAGKGVLGLRIAAGVTVETSNNELSDSVGDLQTLIDPSDAVYAQASSLKLGQTVMFSGEFGRSEDDCVSEESLTQEGSMTEPEFLFKFLNVQRE